MADKTAPEKDLGSALQALQKDTTGILEKISGVVTGKPLIPTNFISLHENASRLLLWSDEARLYGDMEKALENEDLADMLVVMDGLDKIATSGLTAEEGSVLSLIPEDIVITEEGNHLLIKAIGGEEIEAGEADGEKISIEKAMELAKRANAAERWMRKPGRKEWLEKDPDGTQIKEWLGKNSKDKKIWESISKKDRAKLTGVGKVLGAIGLDPDSITKGVLGSQEYVYINAKTGQEIKIDKKNIVTKTEFYPPKLVIAGTNKEYRPKAGDPEPKPYRGELLEDWDKNKSYMETTVDGEKIVFSVENQVTNQRKLTTRNGEKIIARIEKRKRSILPAETGWGAQEISLRQLFINISRERAGALVDAYLTTLANRGKRLGWQEVEENRGIVIEGIGFGTPTHEVIMRLLHNTGTFDKWRAVATLSEQNYRFEMFFKSVNRKDAQKSTEGGRLSQLASADNMAEWIGDIPDFAGVLSWQEWQGFRNPKTGEPLDYPAAVYKTGIENVLQQRLEDGGIKEIVKRDGTKITGGSLNNYEPQEGDIFVLKIRDELPWGEEKSGELIKILKEQARYYGVDDYVAGLAFNFARFTFLGQDRGESYHKAQIVDEYKQISDILGLGWNIKEDYAKLTKEQKGAFEKLLKQMSISQTGVKSMPEMVWGYRDQNPQNRDKWFREAWGDRSPLYGEPMDLMKERIRWSDQVNWPEEVNRREIYRWMGEFMSTAGKGLMDVAGSYAGRETPFNPANPHHREALINQLMKPGEARELLMRVGFNFNNPPNKMTLTPQRLNQLINQIFPDNQLPKMPEQGQINFLSALNKFNEVMGYDGGLEAGATDFNILRDEFEEFKDAVRLEKVLENPEVFGNLLRFTEDDGWTPNQQLINKIKNFGGPVNKASYDQHVYYMLYWYQTYLVVAEEFVHLRLLKHETSALKLEKSLLNVWQDQSTRDVRGTRAAFAFHLANEIHDEFLREEIRKDPTQISHDSLNKMHDRERLWRDAVLFYQEPRLDPEAHEKMIEDYGDTRMKHLHFYLDQSYLELLRRKQVGLQEASGLVDPEGKVKMFKFAVMAEDGTIVGPGEGKDGRNTDKYLKAAREARSRFMQSASDLDTAGWLYQLDMGSVWNDKLEVQEVSKDGQGLNKFEVMEAWYGVVENDVQLYNQMLEWCQQLKSMPKEEWFEKDKSGRFDAIPEILVGFAREYMGGRGGKSIDLRADTPEAEAYRAFFRRWLYFEDKGGYRAEGDEEFNEAAFNKSFQVLIALMFATDIGTMGIPEDPSRGPNNIAPLRYFLFINTIKPLIRDSKDQEKINQHLGFYDLLMNSQRAAGETWANFFAANKLEFLAEKEEIIRQMASLVDRDRMFSQKYEFFPKIIQQWLGLSKKPDAIDFSMADEVSSQLKDLVTKDKFNEVRDITNDLTAQITSGRIQNNVEAVSKYIAGKYGLRVLPRGYWLIRVFGRPNWFTRLWGVTNQVPMNDIKRILDRKLSQTRQARRWVFKNYGVDIGDHSSMPSVYAAIERQIPAEFRNENNPEAKTYFTTLRDVRKNLRGKGPLKFLGYRWLDETIFNKPNKQEAEKRISQLYEAILTIPADRYYGVLKQSKTTAQLSRFNYEVLLNAGQMAFHSVAEKVKKYEELRGQIPYGQMSWELLDLYAERIFGFNSRPLDARTDFYLSMEQVPMPIINGITNWLGKAAPALQGADNFIKLYVDAPWGAVPGLVVTLPVAFGLAGGFAGGWLTLGAVAGTYWLTGRAAAWVWSRINHGKEKKGTIEYHPKEITLTHKGLIK